MFGNKLIGDKRQNRKLDDSTLVSMSHELTCDGAHDRNMQHVRCKCAHLLSLINALKVPPHSKPVTFTHLSSFFHVAGGKKC